MKVLKMTVEDVKEIGNILQDEFDNFWNNNVLEQEVLKEECRYIVAKTEEGEIIGFAGILINIDIVEIMNIVVKKSYRHKGVGQKLLEELIKMAKESGFDTINLEVNSQNEPAINLYKKLGFKEIRS